MPNHYDRRKRGWVVEIGPSRSYEFMKQIPSTREEVQHLDVHLILY